MSDKIKINLVIADNTFPLTIDRKDEMMIREAARQVNMRMNAYRTHYSSLGPEKLLGMVAYEFSLENLRQKDKNDTAPFIGKFEELTELLEDYLKEEKSR